MTKVTPTARASLSLMLVAIDDDEIEFAVAFDSIGTAVRGFLGAGRWPWRSGVRAKRRSLTPSDSR